MLISDERLHYLGDRFRELRILARTGQRFETYVENPAAVERYAEKVTAAVHVAKLRHGLGHGHCPRVLQ